MFKKITIKQILAASAAFITLLLLTIGIITNHVINDTFKQIQHVTLINDIQNKALNIRKVEKEFMVFEVYNTSFHQTKQSKYIDQIKADLLQIDHNLELLNQSKTISKLNLNFKIQQTGNMFALYNTLLDTLVGAYIEKGFKDYGLEGMMREKIHTVETAINKLNKPDYQILMLTLRRHEKDYLLRKDLQYRQKFNAVCTQFFDMLELSPDDYNNLAGPLANYRDIFYKVIDTETKIGYLGESGYIYQINKTNSGIEGQLTELSGTINNNTQKNIDKLIINLFMLIFMLSAIIVTILLYTSRHVVRSISTLRHYITRLGDGELPDQIPIYNNDEIAHMKESINNLTINLKNTRDFAEAVGNGNFEKEVNVFNNHGQLGSALVDMRKKLLQIANEREKQIADSENRIWKNQSFNTIHSILTANYSDNNKHYYNIITKLVNIIDANQGTLFITQYINNQTVLVQKGTYAFDRARLQNNTVLIGEGLIGEVAFEKATKYFTHIPQNYIKITSGLGNATPTNLVIVPCIYDNELLGIFEIASFKNIENYQIEFLEQAAIDIAAFLQKIKTEQTTNELLRKTQVQATELVEKEEEMRQNLEELKATQEIMKIREEELLEKIKQLEDDKHYKNKIIETVVNN